MSKELEGATLFQSNYKLPRVDATIVSNKNAEIFIALTERDNKDLKNALNNADWTLRNGMYIQGTNYNTGDLEKLNKVWSKEINAGKTVEILLERKGGPRNPFMFMNLVGDLSESGGLVIAILIKEGRF